MYNTLENNERIVAGIKEYNWTKNVGLVIASLLYKRIFVNEEENYSSLLTRNHRNTFKTVDIEFWQLIRPIEDITN